ncbi:MAG TPA: hypothetical protein VGC65_08880 [Bacteroidia bacterium]
MIFCFSAQASFGQQNNQQEYDINDPRNPDCPCHKYQQMADNAYEQLQNENQTNPRGNQQKNFHGKQFTLNTAINTGMIDRNDRSAPGTKKEFTTSAKEPAMRTAGPAGKIKKKKPGTWIIKKINRAKLKHSKIKKQRPDYSVCYKW